jgi:hypothetical protein
MSYHKQNLVVMAALVEILFTLFFLNLFLQLLE